MAKNKSTSVFIVILSIVLLNSLSTFAQNYPVIDLNDLINSPDNYNQVLSNSKIEEVENLVYNLNPTIFIGNSGVKKMGDGTPVTAVFSADNFQALQNSNPDFRSVKLLKIKLEESADLTTNLDLSSLAEFQNLEYIFLQCAFSCNISQIQNMFSNVGGVKILFVIATPK